MTLHLLKKINDPFALQVIHASQKEPLLLFLGQSDKAVPSTPTLIQHLCDLSIPEEKNCVSYERLIDLIFTADRVITWC